MPSGSSDLPSPTSSSAAAGEAGGGARRDPCREAGDDAGLSLTWCPCRPLSPPSSPPSQLAAAEAEAESQREAAASVSSLLADVRSEAGASRDTARRLEVSHAQLEANAASYRAAVVAAMGEARASAARVAELSSALRAAEAGASAAGETDARWRAASDRAIAAEARCGELHDAVQDAVARRCRRRGVSCGRQRRSWLSRAHWWRRFCNAVPSHHAARALGDRWDVWQLLPPRHAPPPLLPFAPRHSQPAPRRLLGSKRIPPPPPPPPLLPLLMLPRLPLRPPLPTSPSCLPLLR